MPHPRAAGHIFGRPTGDRSVTTGSLLPAGSRGPGCLAVPHLAWSFCGPGPTVAVMFITVSETIPIFAPAIPFLCPAFYQINAIFAEIAVTGFKRL